MIKSGRAVNASSYQDMMRRAFGPVGAAATAFFQVLFALGCTICNLKMIIINARYVHWTANSSGEYD